MRIKIACIKFGGLAATGTEKWYQVIAANLPEDEFIVDYYYCDACENKILTKDKCIFVGEPQKLLDKYKENTNYDG